MFEQAISPYIDAFGQQLTLIQHEVGLGMEAASNTALAHMREQETAADGFVIVHDDDDRWHPDFLLKTTNFLQKSENCHYAGVITNCQVIYEKITGNQVKEHYRTDWNYFKPEISYLDLFFTNISPPISFLIRRDVVDKIGVFNAEMPVLGDWDFILRVMQQGDIATINEPLAYYHQRIKEKECRDIYANTATEAGHHQHFNTLYTNALIRASIRENPSLLGLFRCLSMIQHEQNQIVDRLKHASLFRKIRRELKRWRKKYF